MYVSRIMRNSGTPKDTGQGTPDHPDSVSPEPSENPKCDKLFPSSEKEGPATRGSGNPDPEGETVSDSDNGRDSHTAIDTKPPNHIIDNRHRSNELQSHDQKLTQVDRDYILAAIDAGKQQKQLAAAFGVSEGYISDLKRRHNDKLRVMGVEDGDVVANLKKIVQLEDAVLTQKMAQIIHDTPDDIINKTSLRDRVVSYGILHDKLIPPSIKVEHEHKLGWLKAVQKATTKRMKEAKSLQEGAIDAVTG